MSGLLDGKQIREESIPATKLEVVGIGTTFLSDNGTYKNISPNSYTVYGDLTVDILSVTIEELNIIISIEYQSSTTARLGIRSISGNQIISVNRVTKYDTSSYEGYVNNALSVNENVSYVIDGLIYTNSDDRTEIEFADNNIWYTIKYFISNNGTNARMNIIKQ